MAKKMTYTELQEFIKNQVGIYSMEGSEHIFSVIDKLAREAARTGGKLPTRTDIHRASGKSLTQVKKHMATLEDAGRVVVLKTHSMPTVWYPNTPEFTGE